MQSDQQNDMEALARAADRVIGSDAIMMHSCRNGTWFFYGALFAFGGSQIPNGHWPTVIAALLVGWALNERERRAKS